MHRNAPFRDKNSKKFYGEGTAPSPDLSPVGEGAPPPQTPRIVNMWNSLPDTLLKPEVWHELIRIVKIKRFK